ncbi:hypothetical protein ACVIYH_009118 [Bradyrhizobium diazoefficiens]
MSLLKWGPWTPDTIDYEAATPKTILNVIPRADGYGPFPSVSAYTQALPAVCRGGFYALKSDGTVITFAGTSTKLYRLNNTDFSWVDVSKGGGTYTAPTFGSLAANWQFAQFGNLVFATHANTVLQVYDLSSSSAFADCAGSPPQAAYIAVVGRFLVLSGLLSNPYRIQWSGLNATTTWTSGVNSSDFQDFPDGGIVRGVAGGEFGVVFQDQAIRRMSFIPGSPLIFQIDRIAQDKGLYAPYSIVRAGEQIFYYGTQGFAKIAPGGYPEPIGREKIDRTFLTDLDKGNLQLMIGASDPRTSRVYWSYKSANGLTGLYDKIIGYDYALDQLFQISDSGEYLLGISQTGLTLEALDSISSSIDAMSLSLDAYATAVQPELAQFSATHNLGFYRGPNLEATLESGEQGTDGKKVRVKGFRAVTDAATHYGSCSYRDTSNATATSGAEVLVSARTGRCDMQRETRYTRFKVRIPAGTSWNYCVGVEPDIAGAGSL